MAAGCCILALAWMEPAAAKVGVSFSGGARVDTTGGTLVVFVSGITNPGSATGTLEIEVWASTLPGEAGNPGDFELAQFELGVLPASSQVTNLSLGPVPYNPPPDGLWYYTVVLKEFLGGASGFTTVDTRNAGGPVLIGNPPPPPAPTTQAIEYYLADWNFYFVTASAPEIAALDSGAFGGAWQRTGESFNVWPQPTTGAVPTCRFFSTGFAPKSTHFYTPFVSECALLKASPAWSYEGIAFYVMPLSVSGGCASGTVPLYRLYNNGMGGAPNHRFTTSISILDSMIATGWAFEGNGITKAFACVPQ
jgi:uncharacterized protein DUF5648